MGRKAKNALFMKPDAPFLPAEHVTLLWIWPQRPHLTMVTRIGREPVEIAFTRSDYVIGPSHAHHWDGKGRVVKPMFQPGGRFDTRFGMSWDEWMDRLGVPK